MTVQASEQAVQASTGAVAAVSATGAGLSIAKAWVLELFGVSLPVLLAAATGAFGARSFLPTGGLWRAFGGSLVWTFIGAFGAEGVRALAAGLLHFELPPGVAPFSGLVIAGAGQLLFTPELVERARAALVRWVDGLGAK